MDSSGRKDYLTNLVDTGQITTEVFGKLLHLEKENTKNDGTKNVGNGTKNDGDGAKNDGDGAKNDGDGAKNDGDDKSEELGIFNVDDDVRDDDTFVPETVPKLITSSRRWKSRPITDPFNEQIGVYDPKKPKAPVTRPLPVTHKPPVKPEDAIQGQAQDPIITPPKVDAPTEGQLIDITKESPQAGGSSVSTKTAGTTLQPLGLRLEGLQLGPRERATNLKGRPSNNKQPGAKGRAANKQASAATTKQSAAQAQGQAAKGKESTATTKQSAAQVQKPSNTQKGPAKDSGESLNSQQESRLKTLGMTSDEALRFACPWDMYLQHDDKRCTDVSCPFNHTSSGNLEYKPLMCPFWAGKGGKHARCTKPANVCKLAHFECGHKQYGALPPGWVIRK